MFTEATPEIILEAYKQGVFPMADSAQSSFYNFYAPDMRGQLSINNLHIPKKLLKTIKSFPFDVRIDTVFGQVIDACAGEYKGRNSTWINPLIRNVFIELHELGHAHSVECWDGGKLIGGLYGLQIGKVFCGESMFSTQTDASKIALVHLCARLWKGDFSVLDTQFINDHLKQFEAFEIPQKKYVELLNTEMVKSADFILEGQSEKKIVTEYLKNRS